MATYRIELEGGRAGDTEIEADTLAEAIEEAKEFARDGDWDQDEGTIWIDTRVYDADDDEVWSGSVAVDPPEPADCDHEWQSPHAIVGGLEENPGVHGHGGGVIITEVCMRCGTERTTDTWAQNPETGEQGLTSVSYEAGKYTDEIREMRMASAVAALADAGWDVRGESAGTLEGTIAISIDDESEGEDALAAINSVLTDHGAEAVWTGNSDTDADGSTTADARIRLADE